MIKAYNTSTNEDITEVFKNGIFEVAVKIEGGDVLFDVEGVARSLGITYKKNNVEYVRWNRVNSYLPKNSPQVAKGDLIPESLVYKLAFKASNSVAEKFQDWIAIDVVPTIRKNGAYMTPQTIENVLSNPDMIIELATRLKEHQQSIRKLETKNKVLEQHVHELKPKADYTDVILKNKSLMTITQIAKDYGKSAREMNKILHELGVQYKQSDQWLLYAKHHKKGYTHSETIRFKRSDGSSDVKLITKWTQKGRLFIYQLLKDNGILPLIELES